MSGALVATVLATLFGADSDWTTDAAGRTFRVGFDPGSRYLLGAMWDYDAEDEVHRLGLEVGWHIRAQDHDANVVWKYTHVLGEATLVLDHEVRVEALLYRGEFLRWARDGKITIPTTPPSRIGFPLDIGVSLELGRWRTRPESDKWRSAIGVIATELLFDFWRSPEVGSYFVLAVGPSYDVWVDRADTVRHVVAPFSRARLALHHEWCRGKQVFDASVDAMTAWTSDTHWAEHVGADIAYEWTFLAVNDDPLSLRLAGQWRWDELLATGGDDGHELRVSAGLRLGL